MSAQNNLNELYSGMMDNYECLDNRSLLDAFTDSINDNANEGMLQFDDINMLQCDNDTMGNPFLYSNNLLSYFIQPESNNYENMMLKKQLTDTKERKKYVKKAASIEAIPGGDFMNRKRKPTENSKKGVAGDRMDIMSIVSCENKDNVSEESAEYNAFSNTIEGEDGARDTLKSSVDIAKTRRRERNRTLARKTRAKKKLELETLRDQLEVLKQENDKLRDIVMNKLTPSMRLALFAADGKNTITSFVDRAVEDVSTTLDNLDTDFIYQINCIQKSFILCSTTEPDCPIVYASPGFLELTGYSSDEVIGKNCRLLQGPGSSDVTVHRMRMGVTKSTEVRCIVRNYKKDGTPFWNLLQITPMNNIEGTIPLLVGVQLHIEIPVGKEDSIDKFNQEMMKLEARNNGNSKFDSAEDVHTVSVSGSDSHNGDTGSDSSGLRTKKKSSNNKNQ